MTRRTARQHTHVKHEAECKTFAYASCRQVSNPAMLTFRAVVICRKRIAINLGAGQVQTIAKHCIGPSSLKNQLLARRRVVSEHMQAIGLEWICRNLGRLLPICRSFQQPTLKDRVTLALVSFSCDLLRSRQCTRRRTLLSHMSGTCLHEATKLL